MGILDAFNSYDGQQALGLLAAAGGRSDGAGFGQRMLEGLGQGEKWKAAQQAKAIQDIQMQNYLSEIEQRKAATAKAQQNQNIIGEIFGGSQKQAMPESAFYQAADGFGPAAPQSAKQTRQGGIGGLSIDDVTRLKMAGLDVMKEFEWANNPKEFKQGSTYENPVTGKREFMPKIGDGVVPDGRGGFTTATGYADANAAIEGAKTTAVEGAKAGFDLVDVPIGNGQNVKMSRSQALQQLGGAPQSGAMPQGGIPGQGLDMSRVSPEQLQMMAKEDPQALQRGMQRFQGGVPQPKQYPSSFGMTQSPEELARNEAAKVSAVDTAKADVVRDTGKQTNAKMYGQMTAGVDRAIDLLRSGPTASGFGNGVDSALGFFGKSMQSGDTASQLSSLAGWLTANVPRMEGPQSDKDVANYRIQAGMVGDATKPISQRLAAATEVKSLQDKYADLNGYAAPKNGDSAPPKPAANLMPNLPTANASNKGKRARDTLTGEVLVSNGMSWVKE